MGSRHHNSHLRTGQQKPETLPLLSWETQIIQPPLLPESEFHLVPTLSPVSFKWKTCLATTDGGGVCQKPSPELQGSFLGWD